MRVWRTWQMVTVCAVLVVAGLVAWRYLPGPPTRHDDGEGPLSASSGHGGFLAGSRPGTWYLAAAGNLLCLTESGEPATLTRVRYDAQVKPLGIRTFVRTVTPEDLVDGRTDGIAIGTAAYRRAEARLRQFRGTFSTDVAGTVVRQPCSARKAAENGIPDEGFSELVFEMKVDRRGALVPRTYVDYTRGGRAYTLVVNWEMGACGTRTRELVDEYSCRRTLS
jgi:hypothetical protein